MFDQLQSIWSEYLFTPETGTVSVILAVLSVVAMWVVFVKAGRGGWRSLVPVLNLYTLVEIADTTGWKFLLLLIPVVGAIYYVLLTYRLARAFGKGLLFAIGMMLFQPFFMLILGFGKAKYRKRR